MVTQNRVGIGPVNGLFPDGTKPFPEPLPRTSDIHLCGSLLEILQPWLNEIILKIIHLIFIEISQGTMS